MRQGGKVRSFTGAEKCRGFFPGTLLNVFCVFKLWKQRVLWKDCDSGVGHWRDEGSRQQESYTAWERGISAPSSEMGLILCLYEQGANARLWPKGLEQMGSEKSSSLTSKDPNNDWITNLTQRWQWTHFSLHIIWSVNHRTLINQTVPIRIMA